MKKTNYLLCILISLFCFSLVSAKSFNLSLIGEDTFENESVLFLQIDNLSDFTGSCNGLCGLVGSLEYDSSKIELISISALENFEMNYGENIVLYKSIGVSSKTKILEMKFKNKGLSNNESAVIKFEDIMASDGDSDISSANIHKQITFISSNKTNTTVSNNNPKNNTKKDSIKKSPNNYLTSITLSDGDITFLKEKLVYDINVEYDVNEIKIDALVENENATVNGTGNHQLVVGKNIIELEVKAEDGSIKTYVLNITREDKKDNASKIEEEVIKENKNILVYFILTILLVLSIIGVILLIKNKMKKPSD